MKTIERAHMPNKLWERVKLHRNYEKALETIDKHMQYWPKLLVHKLKQRLTKMTQYRIRMRKLQLKVREKIMTVPRKEKKREARREEKAERAAVLDKSIERELLERLKKGVYGDIYNYPVEAYNNVLEMEGLEPAAEEDEEEPEIEYVEGYEDLEEEEDMEDFGSFAEEDNSADDEHDDAHEDQPKKKQRGFSSDSVKADKTLTNSKSKRNGRVLIEVEDDKEISDWRKLQF
ncbi:protein MAK16 homolog B [Dendrobium catenatum]|uniref:protein MAK16 homolog B n=1 Tax=Dendrobium catenatum TaxID=906689 RepID=UPI0009F4B6D8|nr:protein MAK16 homolog B [Dendrobium catenatum]